MSEKKVKTVKFRPRARLINMIGGDLIKDEFAGLIELVKNSYDADAELVTISFVGLDTPDCAMIVIEDDGHGMSSDVIIDRWMSPATESKRIDRKSPEKKRPLLGMMGIGRFSAMRLGKTLDLESTSKDCTEIHHVSVDWDLFNQNDKYLEDISIDLEEREKSNPEDHWTRLTITRLRDAWDDERADQLVKELRLLISPSFSDEQQFSITVDLTNSGLKENSRTVAPIPITPYDIEIIDDYSIKATIQADGSYEWTYERYLDADTDQNDRTDTERGRIYDIIPEDCGRIPRPLACGPLRISLTIRDRDKDILERKLESLSSPEKMGVTDYRRVLDKKSGVAIYRDGFRVRPYGDPDQDWLSLAQRRVQNPTMRLGPNQLFGIIEISGKNNPFLEDKSSREGLKENDAYRTLKAIMQAIFSEVEEKRFTFRERKGYGRTPERSLASLKQKREELFENIDDIVKKEIADKSIGDKISKKIESARKAIDAEHDSISFQAEIMQTQHALGVLADYIMHESRNLEDTLKTSLRNMDRKISKSKEQFDGKQITLLGKGLTDFEESLNSAHGVDMRLEQLIDDLDPITKQRRGRTPKTSLSTILDSVLAILGPGMKRAHVKIDKPEDKYTVLAHEADVFLVIFNVVHNASYWVTKVPNARAVRFSCEEVQRDLIGEGIVDFIDLTITDTGPGVPETVAPNIFNLGFSKKSNGRGMGLFLAKEATRRMKGNLELVNPGMVGASFRISLRRA